MATVADVPIPARLADRPTVAGLVVPHISVSDGTHHLLGQVHRTKQLTCIRDYRCQIDGQPLGRPLVVLVSETGLAWRGITPLKVRPLQRDAVSADV